MRLISALLTFFILCSDSIAYDPLDKEERNDYVAPVETWQEESPEIPKTFSEENLQSFSVPGPNNRFQYFIERDSLQTGGDGVTRFLLVIRSNRGAVNSSYEGLRCGLREHKIYAYGDGEKLTPMPGSAWEEIPKGGKDYRTILYEDLICNLLTGKPNPPDTIFNAMRDNHLVNAPFIGGER